MSMKECPFAAEGAALVAEVACGFAQLGSYTLLLWEKDQNVIVLEERGNFINPDDDSYELPEPSVENDGRILECIATVAIVPPETEYRVNLTVSQAGDEICRDVAQGESDKATVTVDLFLKLQAT